MKQERRFANPSLAYNRPNLTVCHQRPDLPDGRLAAKDLTSTDIHENQTEF